MDYGTEVVYCSLRYRRNWAKKAGRKLVKRIFGLPLQPRLDSQPEIKFREVRSGVVVARWSLRRVVGQWTAKLVVAGRIPRICVGAGKDASLSHTGLAFSLKAYLRVWWWVPSHYLCTKSRRCLPILWLVYGLLVTEACDLFYSRCLPRFSNIVALTDEKSFSAPALAFLRPSNTEKR